MFVVSACLAGENCRYDGSSRTVPKLKGLIKRKEAVKICPEVLGGLPIPRQAAEIRGGDGEDVLSGTAMVLNAKGEDLTYAFIKGAEASYEIAKNALATTAILKSKSPSCGCGMIYDGSFSGKLKKGNGVTAALFRLKGIKVMTEKDVI